MATAGAEAEATAQLEELRERRTRAAARVDALAQGQRAAGQALAQSREALAELERRGGRQAERAKLETALVSAEARVAEPWQIRSEGARRALRDADSSVRAFVSEHLDALVK